MKNLGEWIRIIVIAALISLPIRFFIAEPFVVNGASMDPTFSTGQFLIVDRLTYRFSEPERGDVIVFTYPNNPKIYYIKRIVGLPEENLNVKNGFVMIQTEKSTSSTPISEPYITENHRSHDNFDIILGKDEYFVMGDNRIQSSDSRVWGPLDKKFIVGKPFVRLFPFDNIKFLPGQEHQNK